jgi:hypothetical protein
MDKKFFVSREKYLELKAIQKKIFDRFKSTEQIDLGSKEPRYVNIIYGLVKGKTYLKIERKVREHNEVDNFSLERYCSKYGVDFETVKGLVECLTPSSKS